MIGNGNKPIVMYVSWIEQLLLDANLVKEKRDSILV